MNAGFLKGIGRAAAAVLATLALSLGSLGANADTVYAIADTTASSNDPDSTSGGTASTLRVQTSSQRSSWSYVKFDLNTVPAGLTSVKLRLKASVQGSGGIPVAVYPVADTGWSENSLSWNTKPAMGSGALATVQASSGVAQWYEWDVTAYVQAEKAAGRNIVSLGLTTTKVTSGNNYVTMSSRESNDAPELLAIPSALPPQYGEFLPVADATVSTWDPGDNFGRDLSLEAVLTETLGNKKWSYLKFDTAVLGSVSSAKLRIYGHVSPGSGTVQTAVYAVPSTSWGEYSINWSNKPPANGPALATVTVAGGSYAWYEWDVTAYVQAEKAAGRNVLSFVLQATVAQNIVGASFVSREGGTAPRLVFPSPNSAKLYSIHTDHLNTPRLVADASQQSVWKWDQSEPFGVNTPDENPSALGTFDLPLRLPGQYFDKETNLHHNYFRDFDPSLGRYGESDPIGLRGGLNTYLYVAGSPFKFSDARGLDNPAMGPYNPPPGWVSPNSPALNYQPIRRNQSATVQQSCICRPRDEADREFNKVAGTFAVAGAMTVATLAAIAVASAAPEVATVAAGDALIMAIAGEPLLTPFLTGLMMSGYGFVVGGSIGAGIVQLTQPPVCK